MRLSRGIVMVVALGFSGFAQQNAPLVRHAPPVDTDPASGVGMYRAYCAVCHGLDGRGGGPAAPALRRAPADLTQLAQKNGGPFPMFRVSDIIQGDSEIAAHGSREMPIWGDLFRGLERDETLVKLRVHNLARYLASLQPAPTKP
jgi:mono/diheme cytochrome c family protein